MYAESNRSQNNFVKINCAALPATLLESELYGYEKGAFTGAHKKRYGKFLTANKGVLFLDEIRITSYNVCYTKLLRQKLNTDCQ